MRCVLRRTLDPADGCRGLRLAYMQVVLSDTVRMRAKEFIAPGRVMAAMTCSSAVGRPIAAVRSVSKQAGVVAVHLAGSVVA